LKKLVECSNSHDDDDDEDDEVATKILSFKLVDYLLLYLFTNYNMCYSCINFLYIKLIRIYNTHVIHTRNTHIIHR